MPNLFIGNFFSAFPVKKLLKKSITDILNISTMEYTKRKYFNYLNLDVFDSNDEDIKKHFRITNRFISEVY